MKRKNVFAVLIAVILVCVWSLSAAGGAPPSMPTGGMPGGGADTMTYDYAGTLSGARAANGTEETVINESVSSATVDENALLAQNGGTLTVSGAKVEKSGGDSNGDNCNFYGINSIALSVGEGSALYLSDSALTASGEGSNGVFATDSGTAWVYNTTIATSADNSRGLDATYGGTIVADSLKIDTQGEHCAALATDRGGGNISVTNSTLNTAGSGSPLLYSTGNIQVSNVTGTATGSQIAGMEGLNTILIENSTLSSSLTGATASDPIADGIIIYQSTSGDAEAATGETATFQAVGSTLSSAIESGAFFYVTNTAAEILLKNTELRFDSAKAKLMVVAGNDANNWGTAGSNGGTVTFTADGETLNGDIEVDTISSLDLYLLNGTVYTGAMTVTENSVNTNASSAPITVNIDRDSTWVVTADTTVSALNVEEGGTIVDANGEAVSVIVNGQTAVAGTSSLKITVTGAYSENVTIGTAQTASADYLDRAAFDAYFHTNTDFASLSAETQTVTVESSAVTTGEAEPAATAAEPESAAGIPAWFWILPGVLLAAIVIAAGVLIKKRRK